MSLRDDINARAAADPAFAAMLAVRDDSGMAAALSVGRKRLQSRMVTERGVLLALGPVEGEQVLRALEGFGDLALPAGPLRASQAGIARVLRWLKDADGVDVGSPLAQQMLDLMAAVGVLTSAQAEALKALGQVDDVVSASSISEALNNGE